MNHSPNLLLIEPETSDPHIFAQAVADSCSTCALATVGCEKTIRIERVTNVADALSALTPSSLQPAKSRFDAVVVDLSVPDSEGLSAIARLLPLAQDSPILVVSDHFDHRLALAAAKAGAQDFISRDAIDPAFLMQRIYHAMERQHLVTELRLARESEARHAEFRSQFLARMSHELRTPLNGIIGMASVLSASDSLSHENRDMVATIRESGDALLAILNDILDVSKIEAGKIQLQNAPINVRQLIEEALDAFATVASRKGLMLTDIVDPAVPRLIAGDRNRIRQVLFNLLSNAIKYTDHGVVCVKACLLPDPANLASTAANGGGSTRASSGPDHKLVRFDVTDTGVGVSPDMQRLLFQPYVQSNYEDQFHGTGLGLTICKSLARLMGGEIGVTSHLGTGSTFWFTIAADCSDRSAMSERVMLENKNARIAAADDTIYEHLATQFRLRGLVVSRMDVAETGADFAKSADAVDVVIIHQPSIGRIAADSILRSIRDSSQYRNVPVLILAPEPGTEFTGGTKVKFPLHQSDLYETTANLVGKRVTPGSERFPDSERRSTTRMQAIRALVVDDGEVNLKVMAKMLTILGHQCDTAVSGATAVALANQTHFDLIFMDVKMPGMSGIEATQLIRGTIGINQATPIIALTANAFPEDRRICLAAGMSEFMTKPVQLDDVQRVVSAWGYVQARKLDAATVGPKNVNPQSIGSWAILDSATLDQLRQLDDAPGQGSFLDDLIATYKADAPAVRVSLQQALAARDARQIRHFAHKLKGFARNLGLKPLADLCDTIETADEAYASDAADQVAASLALDAQFRETLVALDEWWKVQAA